MGGGARLGRMTSAISAVRYPLIRGVDSPAHPGWGVLAEWPGVCRLIGWTWAGVLGGMPAGLPQRAVKAPRFSGEKGAAQAGGAQGA